MTMETQQTYSGWLVSSAGRVAHYFDESGTSACHRWLRTTLDRPAAPGASRCKECLELSAEGGRA